MFWFILFIIVITWYVCITFIVAWRGFQNIQTMLKIKK